MGLERPVVQQNTVHSWVEDTPQVGSLLPVGLGTISDKRTCTTRICMINAIIGVNDLVLVLSAWQV